MSRGSSSGAVALFLFVAVDRLSGAKAWRAGASRPMVQLTGQERSRPTRAVPARAPRRCPHRMGLGLGTGRCDPRLLPHLSYRIGPAPDSPHPGTIGLATPPSANAKGGATPPCPTENRHCSPKSRANRCGSTMSFGDHIEELRVRLILALLGLAVGRDHNPPSSRRLYLGKQVMTQMEEPARKGAARGSTPDRLSTPSVAARGGQESIGSRPRLSRSKIRRPKELFEQMQEFALDAQHSVFPTRRRSKGKN